MVQLFITVFDRCLSVRYSIRACVCVCMGEGGGSSVSRFLASVVCLLYISVRGQVQNCKDTIQQAVEDQCRLQNELLSKVCNALNL